MPRGVAGVSAYVQFQVDERSAVETNLTIQGQADDDAAGFTSSTGDISERSRTGASVAWAPPAWDVVGEAGADQRTPDLSAVVQEVVDRAGWARGNALVVLVSGTGERVAESYNGDQAGAPLSPW